MAGAHNKSGAETPCETIAEAVRKACIAAAQRAYEDAGMSGLCAEGRWENAIGAMQSLNLQAVIASQQVAE